MPRPPKTDAFDDIRFITNYFLAGCTPPATLVIDLSAEPEKELLLLLLSADLFDIVQTVFSPVGGRKRRPGRHGRKSGRGKINFDANDLVGERIRADINPHNALNFKGTRIAFRLLNAYEGVAFTAALVEGVSDIGFEHLWGILAVNPNYCREIARFQVDREFRQVFGPLQQPIGEANLPDVQVNSGFLLNPFGCNNVNTKYLVNLSGTLEGRQEVPTFIGRMGLRDQLTGAITWGSKVELAEGQTAHLQVSETFDVNHPMTWGVQADQGFANGYGLTAIGFTNNLPLQ